MIASSRSRWWASDGASLEGWESAPSWIAALGAKPSPESARSPAAAEPCPAGLARPFMPGAQLAVASSCRPERSGGGRKPFAAARASCSRSEATSFWSARSSPQELREPRLALGGRDLERGIEQLVNLAPAFRSHASPPRSWPLSQARASRQSLSTVTTETPSAAATSGTVSPPKYRRVMTCD